MKPDRIERKLERARRAQLQLSEPPDQLAAARAFLVGSGLSEATVRNLEDLRVWDYVRELYPGGRPAFKRDWRRGLLA